MLNTRRMPELGKVKTRENEVEITTNETSKASNAYTGVKKLEDLEAMHIKHILEETAFNVSSAAKFLGIGRNTLYRKMDQYGIRV